MIEEYIDYLKSLEDKKLNEGISKYRNRLISFDALEYIAIDNMYLSKANYFKTFQIGNILRG
jgi:hypothetical protein